MCSVSAGCILVGPRDPPGTQHAWSFTGSNKPTLVSKEVFGSNKPAPAYDISNSFKQKPLEHLDLQEVHKHITFLRHNNIHTFSSQSLCITFQFQPSFETKPGWKHECCRRKTASANHAECQCFVFRFGLRSISSTFCFASGLPALEFSYT